MKTRRTLIVCALVVATCGGAACRGKQAAANANGNAAPGANANQQAQPKEAHALPDNAFKAQITLPSPPAKLRAGQQERVQVHVRNASDIFWWARGGEQNDRTDNKFYIAAGDRWLKPDGTLVADDGRYGLGKDLKPGEETELPLLVTAPKEPGEYILEVDLLQEQVAWFGDKGSPRSEEHTSEL